MIDWSARGTQTTDLNTRAHVHALQSTANQLCAHETNATLLVWLNGQHGCQKDCAILARRDKAGLDLTPIHHVM